MSNPCSAPLCARRMVVQLNTTRVHVFHALLLPSKHYYIRPVHSKSYLNRELNPGKTTAERLETTSLTT